MTEEVKYKLYIVEEHESGSRRKIFSREILNTDLTNVKQAVREFD